MNQLPRPMKITLYFDVRFLQQDYEKAEKEGMYVRTYLGDIYFSFSRTVSLPCLPVRGQLYHLRFDPTTETSNADGGDTHYYVRESGFIEDDEKATPYFVISYDQSFSEWQEEDPARKNLPPSEQNRQWRNLADQEMVGLTKLFKKHGWKPDSSSH